MKYQRNIATYLSLLFVLGLATFAVAQDKPATPPAGGESEAGFTWKDMVRERIPSIDLKEVRFEDAIEHLRGIVSKKNLNIVTQWGSLQVDDPEIKDMKVSVSLKDIPFGQALQAILEVASGGVVKLGYQIEGNLLTIDVQEKINSVVYTKTYNVSDLVDFTEPDQVERLTNIIKSNVDRESWYPNGNGQINQMGGVLIVSQTPSNLEAIETLLDSIRKAGFQKAPATPATQAKQVKVRGQMLGNMAQTCFDPEIMGIAAVGGLRTETPMEPKDQIIQFEEILSQTKRQGIRNAIRLTLKDLYIETGNLPAAREQLKMIIVENDNAPKNPAINVEKEEPVSAIVPSAQ